MPLKLCPLCGREIPADRESRHHLTPKLKGGTHGPIAVIHEACHSKIHAVFTEAELARSYNTIHKLLTHEEIRKFVDWIRKRPIDFTDSTPNKRRRRR